MADPSGDAGIAAKLDILIRLQATALVDRFQTQRERIMFLSRAGLTPKAIADILGTSPNSVSVALSKMKKGAANNGSAED
jgi:DNA-binding NarL/FixJ family response regulator